MMNEEYELCALCDHFMDDNPSYGDYHGLAEFDHLDDGEQEFDHDATPSGDVRTLEQWQIDRPDLFVDHGDAIGPNSKHHDRRGKLDE